MAEKKFSKTQKITNDNLAKVPGDRPGVYRIKNAKNEILYVGMAKGTRLDDRIKEHKGEFKGGTQFQYRTTLTKQAAERLEKKEIQRLKPSSNQKNK